MFVMMGVYMRAKARTHIKRPKPAALPATDPPNRDPFRHTNTPIFAVADELRSCGSPTEWALHETVSDKHADEAATTNRQDIWPGTQAPVKHVLKARMAFDGWPEYMSGKG